MTWCLLLVIVAAQLADPTLVTAQPPPPFRVLILGVGATRENSSDRASGENISEFRQNFDLVIELSFAAQVAPKAPIDSPIQYWLDVLHGAANLSGFVTDKVRGELLPLRNRKADLVVVHSWAAPAIMAALNQGLLASPPKELVVVDPPNILPQGGSKWRELGAANPSMRVTVYINKFELFNRVRVAAHVAQHPEQTKLFASSQELSDATRGVLANFVGRNVTVRTFPVPPPAATLIGAHRLQHFFEFAAAHGLHGLNKASGPMAATAAPIALSAEDDDNFLVRLSESTARIDAVSDQVAQREAGIRAPDVSGLEALWRDSQASAWRYFSSLAELACQDPERLGEVEPTAHGVVFSQSTLQQFHNREKPTFSRCANQLMAAVIAFDRPVTFAWIKTEARRFQTRERRAERLREAERKRALREYERAAAAIATSAHRSARERNATSSGDRVSDSRFSIPEPAAMRELRGVLANLKRYDSP